MTQELQPGDIDVTAELNRKTLAFIKQLLADYRASLIGHAELRGSINAVWHCTSGLIGEELNKRVVSLMEHVQQSEGAVITAFIVNMRGTHAIHVHEPGSDYIDIAEFAIGHTVGVQRLHCQAEPGKSRAQVARERFNDDFLRFKRDDRIVWSLK